MTNVHERNSERSKGSSSASAQSARTTLFAYFLSFCLTRPVGTIGKSGKIPSAFWVPFCIKSYNLLSRCLKYVPGAFGNVPTGLLAWLVTEGTQMVHYHKTLFQLPCRHQPRKKETFIRQMQLLVESMKKEKSQLVRFEGIPWDELIASTRWS